jgi:hypothetical protein
MQEERERLMNHWMGSEKVGGVETSSKSMSTGEGEVERGATLPPSSPPHTTHSPHRDMAPGRPGLWLANVDRSALRLRAGCLPACLGSFFLRM